MLASEVVQFYSNIVSPLWSVSGSVMKEQLIGPTCVAETRYPDGSYVHLSKDIDENLYFLWVHNTEWDFSEKEIFVRLDFNHSEQTSYARLRAVVVKGSALDIPIENPKSFLERFMVSNEIQFTIENTNRKLKAVIDKPIEVVLDFGRCVDAWSEKKATLSQRNRR
jgi:hypothetical protein